jgi:hypothetical protein
MIDDKRCKAQGLHNVVEDKNMEEQNELTSQGDLRQGGMDLVRRDQSTDIYSRSSKEARIQEVTTYILGTKELLRELNGMI